MFVTRANALSASSFMADRFSIIALTATKSAFGNQVLGCKSIKLEAAERSFKSVWESAPIKSFKCVVEVKSGIFTMPSAIVPRLSLCLQDFSFHHISVFSISESFSLNSEKTTRLSETYQRWLSNFSCAEFANFRYNGGNNFRVLVSVLFMDSNRFHSSKLWICASAITDAVHQFFT